MTLLRRRTALGLLAAGTVSRSGRAEPRVLDDSVGRRVSVPDRATRVLAAGPPAAVLLYALAPEAMVGWVAPPSDAAKPFLLPAVRALPASGRLTGRGDTVDFDTVLAQKPDLILDFGAVSEPYVTLAERVQARTGVPYALIDGRLEATASTLDLAGDLLGRRERADALAAYASETFALVDGVLARVPAGRRPRVYLARGPQGLQTAVRGSGYTEVLERAGAINVADGPAGRGGALDASVEKIAAWDPDVIVALDPSFHAAARSKPEWQRLRAVSANRLYLAPSLPWGWLGEPPSVNRLIGLRWSLALLYPAESKLDLRVEARAFHRLFYGVAPGDADLSRLLAGAI